jgi:lysophospholipase L1-like esterase
MRSRRAAVVVMVALALAVTAAAGPTTTTRPARLRVLVVGESQAGTLAAGSPQGQGPHGLVARSDLVLWDRTILGCSISSVPEVILATGEQVPNQCGGTGHWQQQWAADIVATRPDVVFVMAGARDLFDVPGPDGTVVHPGDRSWTAGYTTDVEHLFAILGATGAPIVAVKPTCYGRNTLPGGEAQASERLDPVRVQAVTAAWKAAARASGLRLLDLDALTCPGGVADPVIRADGVHFTAAGADRLAPTIAAALHTAVTRARRAHPAERRATSRVAR